MYGYINIDGEEVVPPIYDEISEFFVDDNVVVRLDEKFGIISNTGKIILPVQFSDTENLIKTYITLKENGFDVHEQSLN